MTKLERNVAHVTAAGGIYERGQERPIVTNHTPGPRYAIRDDKNGEYSVGYVGDGGWTYLTTCLFRADAEWLVEKLTDRDRILRQRDALLAACEDSMRQLASLSDRLLAKVPPPHVSYVSKQRAGEWAAGLRDNLRAAIADAKGGA